MEAVNKQDIIKGDPFGEIQKEIADALGQLDKFDKGLKDTAKSFDDLSKNIRKTVQDIDAITKAEIESEKLLKQKIVTQQTETKLLIEQERLKQAAIRTEKAQNSIKEKTLTLYQQESRKLNDLRNAYKNLAVQNKENTKEAKALLAQITPLDAKLKAIDKTVGQGQRSVGLYGTALDNLKSKFGSIVGLASQFGLALGGVALVRGFVETFKEYENAVQSFRTIVSDLSDKDFAKFEGKISDVANTTKRSTIEIAESFENIAGLNADFAKTPDGLGLVSEAASTLSKASKDELGASTENLVGIMNQFDLAANQANRTINVLAAGQAVGASTITQSAEAYKNFGTVAKTSNITLEESQGLIQTLGKFSIFGAEAGTKLRGVTIQLQKANIGYASGQFDINDALVEFKKNLDSKASASEKDAYATKIFGAENITAGKILSNNIGLIDKFTKGVTGTDEAQKAAAINSNTLSNRWTELKNSVTNLITTNNGVTSSFGGLKDALGFITNNLPSIISNLSKLTVGFIAYKTAMAVANTDFKALISNFTKLKTDAPEAGSKLSGFGSALKGIGWSVAIGFAIDLGMQLWDIASGAAKAREAMARFQHQLEKGSTDAAAKVAVIQEAEKQQIASLNQLLNDKKISQSDYNKLVEKAKKASDEELKSNIKKADFRKQQYKDQLLELQILKKQYEKTGNASDLIKLTEKASEIAKKTKTKGSDYLGLIKTQADFNQVMAQLEANIGGVNERLNTYYGALKEADDRTKDFTDHTNDNSESIKEQTKDIKELNDQLKILAFLFSESKKELEGLTKVDRKDLDGVADVSLVEEQWEVLGTEIAVIEAEIALKKAKQLGNTKAILKAEEALKQAKIAQIKAQLELNLAQTDNVNERKKLKKQAELDILNLDPEKAKENNKEIIQTFEDFQKGLTDILSEQIDARIAILKKEEDAAKSTQDYLQELAANGNINAQQSITEAIEFQRESQAEQARLERTKQQIQLISSGLSTFNKELADGKKPGEALISTGFVMQTLIGLLKNVQFFAKGTDNAPEGIAVVDEKGAEIITDKRGKIKEIGTGKGARFTHLNKGDKVYTANQTANILGQFGNIQNGQTIDGRIDVAGNSYDLMMLNKLGGIEKAIKESGSSSHTDWGGIFNGVGEIVERKMKHGNIVTNRYRMRS